MRVSTLILIGVGVYLLSRRAQAQAIPAQVQPTAILPPPPVDTVTGMVREVGKVVESWWDQLRRGISGQTVKTY